MTEREIKHADKMLKKITEFHKEVSIFASQLHNSGEIHEATVQLLKVGAKAFEASIESLNIDLLGIEDRKRRAARD
jgi:hypothetical protein